MSGFVNAGFDLMDWTYSYQIDSGTDVVFEQPPPPGEPYAGSYDSGYGTTYTCNPRPGAPAGVLPIQCPNPINVIPRLGPWVFDDFVAQSSSPSVAGGTFGNPAEPHHPPAHPALPIDFFMIEYDLRDQGVSQMSATIGCTTDPLGLFEGQGRPHCGPNADLGPIEWSIDVGVPTAPIVITDPALQMAYGRLRHASSDPATWHYQDEPTNPLSAYVFDPARCSEISIDALVPGYHHLIVTARIHLRPLSYLFPETEPDPVPPVSGPFVSGMRTRGGL